MRRMSAVTAEQFNQFLVEHPDLEQRRVGGTVCYVEAGEWPDNLVASFVPAGGIRRRDGAWRVGVDEPDAEPLI